MNVSVGGGVHVSVWVGVRVSVWVEMCNGGCKVCGTQEGSGITHCHQI